MKNKKSKVGLWSALTAITAILTIAAIVGNIIANQYATTINVALNASTYQIIHDSSNTEDTEYFKKGFASDEEREAYEAELCAQVEAEGAALLKNQNAALPLAQGAKVSLFGHGSVDLMYGGTGSGSVDTSKAPNFKQALEDQGIHITEVEISYFALHLQLAIEKRKESENLKYNVLCICEKTSSVFHMLSYKINQHFQDRINEIVFAPVSEIKNYYLPDFHVVLCTADENSTLPSNTIYISPYINENDINTIRTAFNQLSSKIMNNIVLKEYLFFDISADSREEVFQKGTDLIQQFIKLPDDFLERLESRESMASTEYDSRIAIPHPIDMSDIPEFISVFCLDKPVLWKTKQVQLIFLICTRGEISPIFYTKFSKIIRDSDLSQKLIQAEDFSKFSEIIESI